MWKFEPREYTESPLAAMTAVVASREELLDEPLGIVDLDIAEKAVTVGRKKRKRAKGAGSGVKVRPHTRSPRGPNAGKKRVRVDGYGRGKAPGKRKRRRG
jgi:hypothetical protein